ncbi:hypothetical protein ACVXHB_22200 [Escherichia coli]
MSKGYVLEAQDDELSR